ncbi:MAG: hypothetical protein ABI051_07290 [Vicinamibacterales bacterium]
MTDRLFTTSAAPERTAAVINGTLAICLAATLFPPAIRPLMRWWGFLAIAVAVSIVTWRTWFYAREECRTGRSGWRGVIEAGALGFGVAIMVLSKGIVLRFAEAPPFVIIYGTAAFLVGALVGMIFKLSAEIVLLLFRTISRRQPGG